MLQLWQLIKLSIISIMRNELRWAFGLNEDLRQSGGAAGSPHSTHLQSRPPKPWPRGGQSGDPNQSPTMMASRLMQNTSTNDDIKYWMGDPDDPDDVGATFNPPTQFPSYYTDYMRTAHHWDSSPGITETSFVDEYLYHMNLQENEILFKIYKRVLNELKDAPLLTKAGRFNYKGKSGRFDVFISPLGIIVGVVPKGDGFSAYNFEDAFWADGMTPEEAVANSVTSEELDEISSIGGGSIAGHIGPLGSDNQSPHLKKKKNKKHYEPSMRAFGGAMEVD